MEVLHQLQVGLFGVLFFQPVPRPSGGLIFDLIPDPNIEGPVENSHGLGISIIPVGDLPIMFSGEVMVAAHADVVL